MFFRGYQRYAEFTGRSTRTEYWLFVLAYTLGVIAAAIVGAILFGESGANVLSTLFLLGSIVPSISVTVRRLHDTNRSGLNALWALLPLIGGIILLVFALLPSDPGSNQYGEPDVGGDLTTGTSRFTGSQIDELEKLAGLRERNILTEAEFDERKARILGR